MSRSDPAGRKPSDWAGWLALAWAIGSGVLYARMVIDERVPGLARAIAGLISKN